MLNLFQPPAGLLGDQEEAVRQQMQMQGLLGLAAGLFQAGTPSRTPQSLGGSALQGLMAGQQMAGQTLTNALQMQEYARQRQERERLQKAQQTLESALSGAVKTAPSTALVPGSAQTTQLANQMEGFGPQDIALTQQALYSAGATQQVPDEAAANKAVMNYLRQVSPIEYAKLAFKSGEEPAQIQTLRALIKDPALMEAFVKLEAVKRPLTSVEVKNEAQRQQNLFKEIDIPIVQGFTNAASSAREFARTSETINSLLKGAGGGKLVQVGTELAKTLGIKEGQIAAADLAQSLVTQAAPRMRAPGSGSTSDLEFKSFMNSIPSLNSSEEGRGLMAQYATAFAERSAKLADYAKKLAREDKLSFEAINAYDVSLGPVLKEDFYKFAPAGRGSSLDFRSGR